MTVVINVDRLAQEIINTISVSDSSRPKADASTLLNDMQSRLTGAYASAQSVKSKIVSIIHENDYGTFPNGIARQSQGLLQSQESLLQNMKYYCHKNAVLIANLSDPNVKDSFLRNVDAFSQIHQKVKYVLDSLAVIVFKY